MNQFKRLFKSLSLSRASSQEAPSHPKFLLVALPVEIVYYILSLLSAKDLLVIEYVCKEVRGWSSSEFIWKLQYEKVWKKVLPPPKKGKVKGRGKDEKSSYVSYRELYKLRHKNEEAWKSHSFSVTNMVAHLDDVICLQYIGDLLATGSGDGTVKLWDLKKKKTKASLKHTIDVFCLQIDGTRLAAGGGERHITLWDIVHNTVISKLPCKDTIKSLQIIDPNILICGSADGAIYQYDLRSGTTISHFPSEIDDVWCLQSDGTNLVCGGVHPTQPLRMFDLRTKEKLGNLAGHTSLVSSLHFEDNILVTGSSDSTVRVWDMTTGKCLHQLCTNSKVFCVYKYDNMVLSGCDNAFAFLWDINTGTQLTRFGAHADAVLCAQFDAQRMVTGSYDRTVIVWDLVTRS